MEKIQLYEYIDLVDPTNKLKEIERRGKKENRYSWCILVDELKKKVVNNVIIDVFIEKVNKNNSFSNIYYNSINKHIDDFMDKINKENQEYLFELQKLFLLISLDDKDFYFIQKNKIYQEMEIINKINIKMEKTNDFIKINFLKSILYKNIEIFEKRKNLLRLLNKNNYISYEDDLIININNNEDIIKCLDFIKYNNIIYTDVKLPKIIKINEINRNPGFYFVDKTKDLKIICKYFICINFNNKNIIQQPTLKRYILNKDNKKITVFFYSYNIYLIKYKYMFTKPLNIKNIFKFYKIHYFDLWRKKHKK